MILSVGLDLSWRLEVPSLWECVQQSVLHSVTGLSSPSAVLFVSFVVDGRCSGPFPCEGSEQTSYDGVEGVLRVPRRRGRLKKSLCYRTRGS